MRQLCRICPRARRHSLGGIFGHQFIALLGRYYINTAENSCSLGSPFLERSVYGLYHQVSIFFFTLIIFISDLDTASKSPQQYMSFLFSEFQLLLPVYRSAALHSRQNKH